MASRNKVLLTIRVLGPPGAGKATTIGCILEKYGAINLSMMGRFQREGIEGPKAAANNLKARGEVTFETPSYDFEVLDSGLKPADCTVIVLSAESLVPGNLVGDLPLDQNKLIILVNKMDSIDWSEEKFAKIVEGLEQSAKSAPIIPISAERGDNILEKSSKSPWYKGWKRNGVRGHSLLEALEASI